MKLLKHGEFIVSCCVTVIPEGGKLIMLTAQIQCPLYLAVDYVNDDEHRNRNI